MLLEVGAGKKNTRYMVGYDLGEEYSQISYCTASQDPETLPVVTGTEQFNIPTVLCKRKDANQWFYGKEAIAYAESGNGILVDHLISRARCGKQVELDGQLYDATALLTLFVTRSFGIFFYLGTLQSIDTLVITAVQMDVRMIELLNRVTDGLALHTKEIYFQSYAESFYEYTLRQPADLWQGQSILFDYREDKLTAYHIDFNRRTTPIVAMVASSDYTDVPCKEYSPEQDISNKTALDEKFAQIVQNEVGENQVTSCYLIGEGFTGDWLDVSLHYLCQGGRRVFQGNNLYSKGAAFGAKERQIPTNLSAQYIFLDSAKLKTNVGMQILRQGEESYLALLDAGRNWYDAHTEYEVYLDSSNSFSLVVTPLSPINHGEEGSRKKLPHEEKIVLDGLPDRPDGTTRLKLSLVMTDVNHLKLSVEDLGFGQIFPASHQIWTFMIVL